MISKQPKITRITINIKQKADSLDPLFYFLLFLISQRKVFNLKSSFPHPYPSSQNTIIGH